jgi:hypothetical protein
LLKNLGKAAIERTGRPARIGVRQEERHHRHFSWERDLTPVLRRPVEPAVEKIPEPDVQVPVSPPVLVTGNVRELLASDQHTARAFDLLCQLLHPDSGYGEAVVEKLQTNSHSLTMHIVTQLR